MPDDVCAIMFSSYSVLQLFPMHRYCACYVSFERKTKSNYTVQTNISSHSTNDYVSSRIIEAVSYDRTISYPDQKLVRVRKPENNIALWTAKKGEPADTKDLPAGYWCEIIDSKVATTKKI